MGFIYLSAADKQNMELAVHLNGLLSKIDGYFSFGYQGYHPSKMKKPSVYKIKIALKTGQT